MFGARSDLCKAAASQAILAMALLVSWLAGSTALAQPVTFSDSTFDELDWDMTVITDGNGGTVTVYQETTGNPTPSMRIHHDVLPAPSSTTRSRAYSFHFKNGAVYDPAVSGPIDFIDYVEDSILYFPSLPAGRAGQRTGPGIEQDGQFFVIPLGPGINYTNWTTQSLVGLTATDFVEINGLFQGLPAVHPDFSADAPPLAIGFVRANSTALGGTTGFQRDGGIDNWRVDIHPETPENMLLDLVQDVIELNLAKGIENSLDAKLDSALGALQDMNENNDAAACGSLGAFINSVEAHRGSHLTDAEADALVAAAEEIMTTVGCM